MNDNGMLQLARLQREVLLYDPQAFSRDDQDASSRQVQLPSNNPPQNLVPSLHGILDTALLFLFVNGQSRFDELVLVPGSDFHH